jgi:hypothetical protein
MTAAQSSILQSSYHGRQGHVHLEKSTQSQRILQPCSTTSFPLLERLPAGFMTAAQSSSLGVIVDHGRQEHANLEKGLPGTTDSWTFLANRSTAFSTPTAHTFRFRRSRVCRIIAMTMTCPAIIASLIPTEEDIQILMAEAGGPSTAKKRVCFDPDIYVSMSPIGIDVEDTECLWYTQKETLSFKESLHKLASSKTQGHPINGESMRGAERLNLQRLRNKSLTREYILQTHRKGASDEHTATVARKCTIWTKELALIQALQDYCDVYQPSMTSLVPNVVASPPYFAVLPKKRVVPDSSPESMNVSCKRNRCMYIDRRSRASE